MIYLLDDVEAHSPFYRLHLGFSTMAIASSWMILQTMSQTSICFFYYTVIIGLVMNVIGTVF